MPSQNRHPLPTVQRFLFRFLHLLSLAVFAASLSACHSNAHTSDPHLRSIDTMLSEKLTPGMSRANVSLFLNARGYEHIDSQDGRTISAVVRHIDMDTLQPVTARVTLHFDASLKLTTYELESAPDAPLPH